MSTDSFYDLRAEQQRVLRRERAEISRVAKAAGHVRQKMIVSQPRRRRGAPFVRMECACGWGNWFKSSADAVAEGQLHLVRVWRDNGRTSDTPPVALARRGAIR